MVIAFIDENLFFNFFRKLAASTCISLFFIRVPLETFMEIALSEEGRILIWLWTEGEIKGLSVVWVREAIRGCRRGVAAE